MLSPEKRLQSRYCKNYFETSHFIRQIFDRLSENELSFWKSSGLESNRPRGVRKKLNFFSTKNESRKDILYSSILV